LIKSAAELAASREATGDSTWLSKPCEKVQFINTKNCRNLDTGSLLPPLTVLSSYKLVLTCYLLTIIAVSIRYVVLKQYNILSPIDFVDDEVFLRFR